jgi:hypothetical protein
MLRKLAVQVWPIDRLIPFARNARTHSDEQVAQVAASIREFGWTNPILVGGDGVIIAGHARLAAARKSTILALDTEAGMVVGLIDSDVPAGFGAFRIQGWRLNRDWSVDLSGKTVTASMYNLTAGTLPAAVSEAVQPRPAVLTGQLGPQTFTVNGA